VQTLFNYFRDNFVNSMEILVILSLLWS